MSTFLLFQPKMKFEAFPVSNTLIIEKLTYHMASLNILIAQSACDKPGAKTVFSHPVVHLQFPRGFFCLDHRDLLLRHYRLPADT